MSVALSTLVSLEQHHRLDTVVAQIGTAIVDKEHAIRLAPACLPARGHLLIEDLPGMGKTILAHAPARIADSIPALSAARRTAGPYHPSVCCQPWKHRS